MSTSGLLPHNLTSEPYFTGRGEEADLDDPPQLAPIGHYHSDIDAALPADDLIGGLKTKRVSLYLLRIRRSQFHMRLRIGKSPRIVLATECALTCAKHLVAWLPTCRQLDEYGPAVTLALEDHIEISSLTL